MFGNVFKIAVGLILVVSVVTSMFALGQVSRVVFERALGVDNCYYVTTPVQADGISGIKENYAENCKKDTTNNDKRNVADALAMLIVSVPLGVFTYRKVRQ